ncbi:kinase-like protein [Patellaria atrata CBS 101060]|uniref:Kinase-like protein n=1 Tax=Patellaria atrata CBS 101060 TaxID=1346257 RepID=A0A9P4VU34_9PEZI|nr:kinase-like protein [Patellaria atrata CBS 101060]
MSFSSDLLDVEGISTLSIDYGLSHGLISYMEGEYVEYSAATTTKGSIKPAEDSPYNFLSLLATAQKKKIDFLPITWDGSLNESGGQASISQSFLSEKLSYVFKRIRRDFRFPAEEIIALRAIISEIVILAHPEIRGHPNIVRLVGICWDISSRNKSIWPVLVFQKAKYGDLKAFVESTQGKRLSFEERLKFCKEIAAAITLMHSKDIVHGDVKPQNVLVFAEEDGNYCAKVTDFGYSTLHASKSTDDREINLPISRPWNAPETEEGSWDTAFSLEEAKLTDVYSFGLLCMWLLFHGPLRNMQQIALLREKEELTGFIDDNVSQVADLSDEQKSSLLAFFHSTLERDPKHRSLDLKDAMKGFASFIVPPLENDGFSTYEMYMPYLGVLPHHKDFDHMKAQEEHYGDMWDKGPQADSGWGGYYAMYFSPQVLPREDTIAKYFQVARSYNQLMRGDFRLWNYIFCLLKTKAESSSDKFFAFQVAFCNRVGFGTPINGSKALEWLNRSGRGVEDLEKEVELVKTDLNPMLYKNLETEVKPITWVEYYQLSEKLPEVQEVYETAARIAGETFGPTHPTSVYLTNVTISILLGKGEYQEAFSNADRLQKLCDVLLGPEDRNTVAVSSYKDTAAEHLGLSEVGTSISEAAAEEDKPEASTAVAPSNDEINEGWSRAYYGFPPKKQSSKSSTPSSGYGYYGYM